MRNLRSSAARIIQSSRIAKWKTALASYFWRSPDRLMAAKSSCIITMLIVPFILMGEPFLAITLALGALAGALSETDDHPRGRVKSLALKVIIFGISSLSVELLLQYPVVLGIGLFFSTIFYLLVGGISERYRGVTFGAQLAGLYTMLSASMSPAWYWQPLLLSSGALFYGVCSLYLLNRYPLRPLDEHLARGFVALSSYLETKANLFPSKKNNPRDIRNRLALQNVQVVNALDCCRDVLNTYGDAMTDSSALKPYLRYFMVLQNMHEKAASSHERYHLLSSDPINTDLLEGIGQTLRQLSLATGQFADSLLASTPYQHPISLGWMVDVLNEKLQKHERNANHPLSLVVGTISDSHLSLQNIHEETQYTFAPRLRKDSRTVVKRFTDQLHWHNPRLRHAIRLALCFVIGFAISETFNLPKGEWIILTSLFVCQPTYGETRRKLNQRILGTIVGVIGGILIIQILPTVGGKLLLLFISTYTFFVWQRKNYAVSVGFVTIFVLCAFDLLVNKGVAIMFPRVIDTLIGSGLAFASVRLLWPNWQYERLPVLLSEAIGRNADYLRAILHAYREPPPDDDLSYRIARRAAHRADNALVLAWQDMQVEPEKRQLFRDQAFALTYLNHALISYLSAFGSKREKHNTLHPDISALADEIVTALQNVSESIESGPTAMNFRLIDTMEKLRQNILDYDQSIPQELLTILYNISQVTRKLLEAACELGGTTSGKMSHDNE